MTIAAGGEHPSGDPRAQHAPGHRAGTPVHAPRAHPARNPLWRVETALALTEGQVIRPRDTDDVHERTGRTSVRPRVLPARHDEHKARHVLAARATLASGGDRADHAPEKVAGG